MIIYKIGIITAVLTSSILASGNPFAVEQNVKKIDQEEGMLLDAIAKEQVAQEDEDEFSDKKSSHAKTKTKIIPPKTAKESVKIKKREITKITAPVVKIEEVKTPPVVNNVTPEPKKQKAVKQEVVKISPVKVVAPKVIPIVVPKKRTIEKPTVAKMIEEVDAQIKKVDAQIKKLQNNLNTSRKNQEVKKKQEASKKRVNVSTKKIDVDKKRPNQSQKRADVNKKKVDTSKKRSDTSQKKSVVKAKKPVIEEKKVVAPEEPNAEIETPESESSIFERELKEAIESVR
ncbi:MAG: hypothetical protein DRG30_00065 [Epsilonproteobacteria bacterium]|nr:MAG: hypothetical protein DRG30_00065 [Campylobacterota bacterium]